MIVFLDAWSSCCCWNCHPRGTPRGIGSGKYRRHGLPGLAHPCHAIPCREKHEEPETDPPNPNLCRSWRLRTKLIMSTDCQGCPSFSIYAGKKSQINTTSPDCNNYYTTLHYTALHYATHYTTLTTITTTTATTIHYRTLHYTKTTTALHWLHYTTLHYTTLRSTLHYASLHYTTLHHTTPHYTQLHYTTLSYLTLQYITLHYLTLHSLHHHKCNCNYTKLITLYHNYNYTTTTTTAALHHTTASSCGWGDRPGDHCNHCNHCNRSKKHSSNHLSVHQWIRSAIRDAQQPISPIGFLFLKLPPPPCAVLLVMEHPKLTWMRTVGTHILGNLYIYIIVVIEYFPNLLIHVQYISIYFL